MKKFVFVLDRALDWRKTQQRLEEVKLERLNAELRALESRLQALSEERAGASAALLRTPAGDPGKPPAVTGFDLQAFDRYRKATAQQAARLEATRVEAAARVAAQIQELTRRRRDVRLIERLREQRFEAWRTGFLQEIDRQAEQAHLARFHRSAPGEIDSLS